MFSIGDAGGEGGGYPCVKSADSSEGNHKANGGTASTSPKGDSFDVNFVAHEMAHQFNLDHTWTGNAPGCPGDQFATAFSASSQAGMELGAGNTLVSYAGDCGKDNVVNSNDPYFHVYSLHEVCPCAAAALLPGWMSGAQRGWGQRAL